MAAAAESTRQHVSFLLTAHRFALLSPPTVQTPPLPPPLIRLGRNQGRVAQSCEINKYRRDLCSFTGCLRPSVFSNHMTSSLSIVLMAARLLPPLGVLLVPRAGPGRLPPAPVPLPLSSASLFCLSILPHLSELTETLCLLFCRFIAVAQTCCRASQC